MRKNNRLIKRMKEDIQMIPDSDVRYCFYYFSVYIQQLEDRLHTVENKAGIEHREEV